MSLSRDHLGRRVIVRRVLRGETGPSGGPAMTDVLGVLSVWTGSSLVVEREDGEQVEIALSDVVAGKPVPPRRPSSRRISPEQLQQICSNGWRAPIEEPLGDWLLRSGAGFTGRANSVLVAGDPGVTTTAALERVTGFYRERGQPPLAQVVVSSPWLRELECHGWGRARQDEADTVVQVSSIAAARRARRSTATSADRVDLADDIDESWLAVYGKAAGVDPHVVRKVLTTGDTCFARVGEPAVAIGRGVVSGDWLGIAAVEVVARRRGEGLALAVVEALLAWGASRGAVSAYLQALATNDAALRLYAGYGFSTHHTYRYLTPTC